MQHQGHPGPHPAGGRLLGRRWGHAFRILQSKNGLRGYALTWVTTVPGECAADPCPVRIVLESGRPHSQLG